VAQINHFAYGWVTPAVAYLLSYLGCLLGLMATSRARATRSAGGRARWLVLAAWAIGGTGIWVMHFMAMIGFGVTGAAILYDVPITVASWLTAVIVVGIGLFVVAYPSGRPRVGRVLVGGLFTGVGVAAMHYSGMAAMRMNGTISYDRIRVGLSVVIAVVAATAALWFTVVVRRARWIAAAAAVMGVAVSAMHYVGMSAMSVHLHGAGDLSGVQPLTFLVPILIFVLLVVLALCYAFLAIPADQDRLWEDAFHRADPAEPVPARSRSRTF
jgi:NO-binding membrane sensor protein with MHYT domain